MRARLSPRLLPEAVAEALFATATVTPCERGAVAAAAARDPAVLQATIDTLLLHVNEATELEAIVRELAANPQVRRAFEGALTAHRAARAPRANPAPRLPTADPRLPCTPLGELEAVTVQGRGVHRFGAPRPVLAANAAGLLLILGDAYRVPRRLVG